MFFSLVALFVLFWVLITAVILSLKSLTAARHLLPRAIIRDLLCLSNWLLAAWIALQIFNRSSYGWLSAILLIVTLCCAAFFGGLAVLAAEAAHKRRRVRMILRVSDFE